MHVRKTARDALFPSRKDDVFFAPRRGDIVFRDRASVRTFADRVNRAEQRPDPLKLRPAELGALALMHEVLHTVITLYRAKHPDTFERFIEALETSLGDGARRIVLDFLGMFPPPSVYRTLQGEGDDTPERYIQRVGPGVETEIDEELLLLWVTNQNPAYDKVRTIVSDHDLGTNYQAFVEHARTFFDDQPRFGPRGETLVELLLAPGRLHPTSILAQVEFVGHAWGKALGLEHFEFWKDVQRVDDLKQEEDRYFARGGPGPGEPLLEAMRFERRPEDEPAAFSPDLGWMPNVVLIAKSVYVWLDQLSKKYARSIRRLDQVPDEELDLLASQRMTGLWLIGLFERSRASRKVKQMRGDADALASAYSLGSYHIAQELGGYPAYENLKARAWRRGIRLAADMVPNHVGIDGDWVLDHPDWFLQAKVPPFPAYRFTGPDLSDDPRYVIQIEDGYWNKTDAAVVYRRHDRWGNEDRFIYHGNDGTSMPWNDTAQLDYLKAEVRHAVIETILHVARMFPIIRFDAAMTLAKKHIQRLWFPLPRQVGQASEAIPSREDYTMTQEQFESAIPVEFWREVVDTVAERAPDTLLLAEAFWMLEGYFVRTLGMHRVYNSAFMNMLKRQENEKYKATITSVLDFDPEILKRFVNFMNNPDEETAIAQFGDDDMYFGVCILMATMPGLPMFGHGQIEGLREKYGMEYRRARYDERPNAQLVARHTREVFPLLEKRYLFSGVEHFALYDFIASGRVDHDVYAYTNGAGSERALVLFNNSFRSTRGRIFASTHRGNLAAELGLDEDLGWWVVMRDVPHGRQYIRPTKDILDGGMAWDLEAFKYHVLMGFRHVTATLERPYDRLAAELAGRGVPDLEFAVRELYLRPVHAPLREALAKGHLAYLAEQLAAPSDVAARAAFEERLGHIVDGLDWMLTQRSQRDVTIDRLPALASAAKRFAAVRAFVRAEDSGAAEPRHAPLAAEDVPPTATPIADAAGPAELAVALEPETAAASVRHVDLVIAVLQLEAVIDLLAAGAEAFEEARSRPPAYLSARPPIVFRTTPLPEAPVSEEAARDPGSVAEPPTTETLPAPDDTEPTLVSVLPPVPAGPPVPVAATAPDEPVAITTAAYPELSADVSEPLGAEPADDIEPGPAPEEPTPDFLVPEGTSPAAASIQPPLAVGTAPEVPWSLRESLIEEWHIATPVLDAFSAAFEPEDAGRRTALVLLGATLPKGALGPSLRLALGTRRGQVFMNVHESGGVYWLSKERFEDLVRFLGERETASGRLAPAEAAAQSEVLVELAVTEGYRAENIARRLGPAPVV